MIIRCFIPFLFFFPVLLLGQSNDASTRKQRRAATALAAKQLQESGLIVRIPTNARQLEALDRLLADEQLGRRKRENIQKRRDQLVAEADSTGHFLAQQFRQHYHIGPLYFVHDSTDIEANITQQNPVFLGEDLIIDPQINGPEDALGSSSVDYLTLRIAPLQGYARNEGFVINDSKGELIPKPFPSVVGFDSKFFLTKKGERSARNAQLENAILRLTQQLRRIVEDFGQ